MPGRRRYPIPTSDMAGTHRATTTPELIARKRVEIDVCMYDAHTLQAEALRGSYNAINARRKIFAEFDTLYEELLLLQLRADVEAMDA